MRYIVWACFGVDADSPEQAKDIINKGFSYNIFDSGEAWDIDELWGNHRVNTTVFVSPALDKLVGVTVKKDERGE